MGRIGPASFGAGEIADDHDVLRIARRDRRGEGFRVLAIKDLVELKLASGMTNPDRLKDLADVQELIRHAAIPLELRDELDPMVRHKFVEIWNATRRDDES
jgi:hypothetical protein